MFAQIQPILASKERFAIKLYQFLEGGETVLCVTRVILNVFDVKFTVTSGLEEHFH